MARGRRKSEDSTLNAVVMIMLFVFLMPIAGIMLIGKENNGLKVLGWILLVLGIIIWIKIAIG